MDPTDVLDRAAPDDLLELAVDRAGVPWQVGVLLVLDRPLDPAEVRRALADRVRAVPRLRRRLMGTPPLCGRPVWVDDPAFSVDRHVREVRCDGPLSDAALLDVAVRAVGTRLSLRRSPWEAVVVTGATGDRGAVVVVFHHVLADGIGGLAALGALVDGAPPTRDGDFPRPAPTATRLFVDALTTRARLLWHPVRGLRRIRDAIGELRATDAPRPPRSSLNRPTGPGRALRVVRVDLAAVHAAAHRHGGTVNDVVLTAVGGALGALLRGRGEQVDEVVASVSISARRRARADRLGNAVGILPVGLPTSGPAAARLREVARRTALGRERPRAASAPLLDAVFRLVAALGALRWIVEHQRLVSTFVTNLRGPQVPLTLLGARVREVVPVTTTTGNVPVVFGALSYAGTLTLTVLADPEACPELDAVVAALRGELAALLAAPGSGDTDGSAPPPTGSIGSVGTRARSSGVPRARTRRGPVRLSARYRAEAAALRAADPSSSGEPVTEDDLADLPEPVARWLRRSGVVGRPRTTGFTALIHGRIRSGPTASWMPFTGEQTSRFGPNPTRLFSLTARRGGLPVEVLHEYRDGHARMRARLGGIVPVLDASGGAMTRAETVTVFNDLCVMAPGALLDAAVTWSRPHTRGVRGTYTVGAETVTAELVLDADADGDLVDFVSDDRLRASADGRTFTPQRWSTPLRAHRDVGGRRIPTVGDGVWHAPEPEGTFPYIEFHIDAITEEPAGRRESS
ncbi:DUF6544 family protein [Pseudonocardia xishanensis]|uniref:diacylglycerol O-acyltransferase n=1 Tax=Pseudonocardia xishanensis TaxID=630995 RepID=A0ABP8RSJ6_9PSEU